MAHWRTKAAISPKRVKIEETLLWGTYRNSRTPFRTVPSPTSYGLPFLKIVVRTPSQTSIAIISRRGIATDFKFGRYIHRVHPNKSPLKSFEKRERERMQGLPKFFGTPYSKKWEKLQTSNFACTFIGSIGKKPINNFWEN